MKAFSTSLVGCLLLLVSMTPAAAADVKRVLIVHSLGSTAPPFTTHSTAFESTLIQEMGRRVDLDEVSLDVARYAQPDMEAAFVDFLLKRLSQWQPDLVVPIGSPAGRFVNKYRSRLFPQTPVLYAGMDRRTLPAGPLDNAVFVGERFDLSGLVEDILQIAPDTKNVAIVIGASPLERYWTVQFRRAFEPFEDRVTFTWFNELSFEQMLEQAATLPPRSFILLALLVRDASGVTHNQVEALQRLRRVASAPINGLFQHELGQGIVGGRLYQAEAQGEEAARLAVRILRGEPVSSFPERIIPPHGPRYDWRELQRWNIPENRLPPGSEILFRQQTVWERYRWGIVAGSGLVLLEAGLIVLLAVNLTKRRRVERALRQSEERLDVAAESAGAGLWSVDLATRRVWATSRLRELLQVGPAENLDYDRMVAAAHPDDRHQVRDFFERLATEGLALGVELRVPCEDGSLRWVATRGHVVRERNAGATRLSGASVDVTERKVAEERVRQVFEAAPNAMVMARADGTIALVNMELERVFGYGRDELIGRPIEMLFPARSRHEHAMLWKDFVNDPQRRPMAAGGELYGRRKDGSEVPVEIALSPLRTGEGLFVVGSVIDLTERRKREAETQTLREGLAHMSRVATVGELTTAIVHEMGQPLTAMLANARAGLRLIAAGEHAPTEVREILQDIVHDTRRAGQVIQHLRSLLLKGPVERQPVLLDQVINDVMSVVLRDAERRQVAVVLDQAPRLPPVSGDRVQLQQVFLNLAVNAFEAMADTDPPRTLTVRTRSLAGERVEVDIADTGPGIAVEDLDRIFKTFVTTKAGGMGIGLSVSHSIVNAHDGRLWAENRPEGGAVFHVVLPTIAGDVAES